MKSKKIFNKIFYQEENKNTSKEFTPFDKENKIDKLSLIVVIVNKGQGISIENILLKNKCSATFTFHGVGTASQETYLNIRTNPIAVNYLKLLGKSQTVKMSIFLATT